MSEVADSFSTLISAIEHDKGSRLCRGFTVVDRHIVKKNRRPIFMRGNRPFVGKSDDLKHAQNHLELHFESALEASRNGKPIDEPVWVIYWFEIPKSYAITKKGEVRKNLAELSNLYELPQDCMESAGLLVSDGQIQAHDFSRIKFGDTWALHWALFPIKAAGF